MRERLVPGPYLSPSAHRARKRAWVRGYVTSLQLFSEEGIIHRLGEGFYQHKFLRPEVILYFKPRSSTEVNVLGGIYIYLLNDYVS